MILLIKRVNNRNNNRKQENGYDQDSRRKVQGSACVREVGVRLDERGDHQDAAQEYARNVEYHHVEQSTPAKQGEDQVTKCCYDECEIGFVHTNRF